ncbi:MFS transporter [Cohnella mopanensis]|uniref:MFS transporter n=1 Tax=Cohnella mopanensis TaxID=2911966 RepID=UPI001EF7F82A|nr:MFS transporter [Cohnella mopanensis]
MDSGLSKFYRQYDEAIWIRVVGTLLTKIAQFMMYPFLVLYLTEKFDSSIALIMAIIGLESVAGFIMNLLFGGFSDRFGRKPTMMLSLAIQSICLVAFTFVDSLWFFAIFLSLMGAGSYMFFPAADAQIADSVPKERRAKVYALLGTAASIGVAVGPMIGVFAFRANPVFVFLFFALVSALYLFLIWWKVPETLPATNHGLNKKRNRSITRISVSEHKTLFLFTLFTIPTSLFAAQNWSTFPLHLQAGNPDNFEWIYSSLLTIGSIASALLQVWIASLVENKKAHRIVLLGYLIAVLSALGYAFFIHYGALVAASLLSVIGSILYGVHLDKSVSVMAPEDMRGRYFSIFGLHWRVSEALGPFLGGLLLTAYNGRVMFTVFAALLLIAGLLQSRLLLNVRSVVNN